MLQLSQPGIDGGRLIDEHFSVLPVMTVGDLPARSYSNSSLRIDSSYRELRFVMNTTCCPSRDHHCRNLDMLTRRVAHLRTTSRHSGRTYARCVEARRMMNKQTSQHKTQHPKEKSKSNRDCLTRLSIGHQSHALALGPRELHELGHINEPCFGDVPVHHS